MMLFRKQLSQASKSDERNVSRLVTCQTAFEIFECQDSNIVDCVLQRQITPLFQHLFRLERWVLHTRTRTINLFYKYNYQQLSCIFILLSVFCIFIILSVFCIFIILSVFYIFIILSVFITFVTSTSFELYYKCLCTFVITSVRFTYVQKYPYFKCYFTLCHCQCFFTYVKN